MGDPSGPSRSGAERSSLAPACPCPRPAIRTTTTACRGPEYADGLRFAQSRAQAILEVIPSLVGRVHFLPTLIAHEYQHIEEIGRHPGKRILSLVAP